MMIDVGLTQAVIKPFNVLFSSSCPNDRFWEKTVSQSQRLFSARVLYEFLDVVVVLLVCYEVLDVEVHAVAPVVAWVCRYVYTLGVGILKAQLLVDGKPVLQRQNA